MFGPNVMGSRLGLGPRLGPRLGLGLGPRLGPRLGLGIFTNEFVYIFRFTMFI